LNVKITDFGVSKVLSTTTLKTPKERSIDPKFIGTFVFKAPETYKNKNNNSNNNSNPFTEQSDIFSYGMICYCLATRTKAFANYDSDEIKQCICEKQERPSLENVSDPMFAKLITQCWEHNPHERIQSFTKIIEFIDEQVYASVPSVQIDWNKATQLVVGSHATLYLADDFTSTGRKCVVKEAKEECVDLLQNEISMLQHLMLHRQKLSNNSSMPKMLGICSPKNSVSGHNDCLVLDYYDSVPLKSVLQVLKNEPIMQQLSTMKQVVAMLKEIHASG